MYLLYSNQSAIVYREKPFLTKKKHTSAFRFVVTEDGSLYRGHRGWVCLCCCCCWNFRPFVSF